MLVISKGLQTTTFLITFTAAFVFYYSPVAACGWWGDGEDDDPDAIIVLPEGQSKSDLVMGDTRRLLKTSNNAAELTKTADRLLALKPGARINSLVIKVLTKAATLGYAPAQNNLGVIFEQGNIAPNDNKLATAWFEKAAKQGEAHAQHSLAMMYYQGRGVSRDMLKARYWLERSAKQGHSGACKDIQKLFGIETCPTNQHPE